MFSKATLGNILFEEPNFYAELRIFALETHNAAGERFIISNGKSLSMKQICMI